MTSFLTSLRQPHPFRPYYYGSRKWDDYLIDIQESIFAASSAQQQALQGTVTAGIEELRAGIEELRAGFEWGLTLVLDRLDEQVAALNRVVGQLDAIREAVQLPSKTRAKELFAVGQRNQLNGLLPEALEKFLEAEREDKVNFPLQLQIGKLLLYARDNDTNLIDLANAEQHLLLAARYAGVEKNYMRYQGEALFHAAVAAYLLGGQEFAAGHPDGMKECLERALANLARAAQCWPEFLEIIYTQAKCHALLGHKDEALDKLRELSDRDRRYLAKMGQDKDFDLIRDQAERVFHQAVAEPGPRALAVLAKLRDVEQAFAEAENMEPKSKKDREIIAEAELVLSEMRASIQGLDAEIESMPSRLSTVKSSLEKVVQCDVVDGDTHEAHGYPSGHIVEHRKLGQVRLKLSDGHLYANGVLVVLYQSPKQQGDGSISGKKLYKEMRGKPALNACISEYLIEHPYLIPPSWAGMHIDFWGTIDTVGRDAFVAGIFKSPALNYRWITSGCPLKGKFTRFNAAAILST